MFTTREQRLAALKETNTYQRLVNGKFSFRSSLNGLKKEAHNSKTSVNIESEARMAAEIYYAVSFDRGYLNTRLRRKKWLDFRRDVLVRLVENAGLRPTEQELTKFYDTVKICRVAHKANTKFKIRKPAKEISATEAHRLLKTKRQARIIYDCGIHVLTLCQSYGGNISGFLRQETVDSLLKKGIISQDVYFNCDGRKSYSLGRPGKTGLPPYLRGVGLPTSYLRACGVRI